MGFTSSTGHLVGMSLFWLKVVGFEKRPSFDLWHDFYLNREAGFCLPADQMKGICYGDTSDGHH